MTSKSPSGINLIILPLMSFPNNIEDSMKEGAIGGIFSDSEHITLGEICKEITIQFEPLKHRRIEVYKFRNNNFQDFEIFDFYWNKNTTIKEYMDYNELDTLFYPFIIFILPL